MFKIFRKRAKARSEARRGGVGETLRTLAWALLIAVLIRSFAFEPFHIPSGSMIPALLVGDYMFVSKWSYGYGRYSFPFGLIPLDDLIAATPPHRGDVVVFRHPRHAGVDYVKRVIGLPGDRVQMRRGVLYLNGTAVPRTRLDDDRSTEVEEAQRGAVRYRETLPGGPAYDILEADGDHGMFDDTPEVVVPEGELFMMGDNRDNSSDSRSADLQFVPIRNLVGRASFLFFSIDESAQFLKPWTWPGGIRYHRLLQGLR